MDINIPLNTIIPPEGIIYPANNELPEPTAPREILKSFTTKHASNYLVNNNITEPLDVSLSSLIKQ